MAYRTKQRDIILRYLKKNNEQHFTAENLLDYLKKKGTPVAKSTIYRYLDILIEEGCVKKYTIEEGESACYQYIHEHSDCIEHYHFKCSKCNELFHVSCEQLGEFQNHILSEHKFLIDFSKTVFYGICENCRKNEEK